MFDLVPFELNLDGNFCDEAYKYIVDVVQLATKYTLHKKQGEVLGGSQLILDVDDDPVKQVAKPAQFE